MYCSHCGNQVLEDDQFCRVCGNPVSKQNINQESRVSHREPVFEYCEIVFESKVGLIFMKSRLWAKATGPKGVYTAACEEKWRNGLPRDPGAIRGTQAACNEMIMQLQNDGWKLLPDKGPEYWSYKFLRETR